MTDVIDDDRNVLPVMARERNGTPVVASREGSSLAEGVTSAIGVNLAACTPQDRGVTRLPQRRAQKEGRVCGVGLGETDVQQCTSKRRNGNLREFGLRDLYGTATAETSNDVTNDERDGEDGV